MRDYVSERLQLSDLSTPSFLRRESRRLKAAIGRIDAQTAFVLVAAAALVILQDAVGTRRVFHDHLAHLFPVSWRGLMAWAWWFGVQGVTGFLLPVAVLFFLFRRPARAIGLGLGDWRFALVVAAIYVPLVVVGTWFLSDSSAFQAQYPHYRPASVDWSIFLVYEMIFLMYWIGWEYLWRGFVLFGTARTLGLYAIFVQAVPFAILHLDKPILEAVLSLIGGIALGALVWRCRSFWIAVPIHALQMTVLDFWCSMRVRTGVSGVGIESLWHILQG